MKIKIIYLIPTLNLGGAEKQQINILNSIDTSLYDVTLIVLKSNDMLLKQIQNENIKVCFFHINSIFDLSKIYSLIRFVKKINPDIMHSHMYNANILARFFKLFLSNVRIINHYHGFSLWMSKSKLLLDKSTKFLVDKFIMVSDTSLKLRLTREKYPKEKSILLYNSVDLNPSIESKKFSLDNSVTIGMASRLIKLKNIDGAMQLYANLLNQNINLRIIIAGDGPEKDYLMKTANKLGISNHIEFIGFIDDMNEFYERIDIFCISSITEDLPLSMIEAIIYGKPIIASNVGGIPDILNQIDYSILINDFSSLDESSNVSNFIKSLDQENVSSELHKFGIENFDNKINSKKLETIYHELLGNK